MPVTATTNFSSHPKQKLNWKTTKSFTSRSALASGARYGQLFIPQPLRGLVKWRSGAMINSTKQTVPWKHHTALPVNKFPELNGTSVYLKPHEPFHDLLWVSYFFKIPIPIVTWFIPTFSFRFSNHKPAGISFLPPTYATSTDHITILFDDLSIWWEDQIIKLPTMLFSPTSCYFLPFTHKYSPQHSLLKYFLCTFIP